jgi:hypothetical protein
VCGEEVDSMGVLQTFMRHTYTRYCWPVNCLLHMLAADEATASDADIVSMNADHKPRNLGGE